ncbi:Lar family restriction alleviation protein [Victivallis vadensis]|uniref:Lar family restriction alleviation protein n=1 Tax=Victivallis vadensis TaxID=172901 RepID=UPI003CFE7C99
MSEKLKPCPFCGADSDISVQDYDTEDPYYVVACTNCNMAHSSSDDENVAIRNWNDRPIEDAQAARIAELEAERDRLREALKEIAEFADSEYGKRIPAPSCVEFLTINRYAEKASKGMGVTCALCWATAIFLVAMAISEA